MMHGQNHIPTTNTQITNETKTNKATKPHSTHENKYTLPFLFEFHRTGHGLAWHRIHHPCRVDYRTELQLRDFSRAC
jgi:hypothetical protein